MSETRTGWSSPGLRTNSVELSREVGFHKLHPALKYLVAWNSFFFLTLVITLQNMITLMVVVWSLVGWDFGNGRGMLMGPWDGQMGRGCVLVIACVSSVRIVNVNRKFGLLLICPFRAEQVVLCNTHLAHCLSIKRKGKQ